MDKETFLTLLGKAYHFPDYYACNLDSADEILEDLKVAEDKETLSLQPLFNALLAEASEKEKVQIWNLLKDHFLVA